MSGKGYRFMAFALAAAILLVSSSAAATPAGPLWTPSHRYGPDALAIREERWDGYDSYDGYFWMHQGFRWTQKELENYMDDPELGKGGYTAVYEFRRVGDESTSDGWGEWQKTEGDESNDHWDGAWGRTVNDCSWIVFCWPNQHVYSEYVTSLPSPNNKGVEENDSWFIERHAYSLTPPSWNFDYCDIVERYGVNSVCDEEYEVGFDPNKLVPNRFYYVAIKFRGDRADGTEPTRWRTEFEVHKPGSFLGIVPYYETKYTCALDLGKWAIDFNGGSYEELVLDTLEIKNDGSNTLKGELCLFDYDSDGVLDKDDNCRKAYNPGQADTDGDGAGDACDEEPAIHFSDMDRDGAVSDNCPEVFNPGQSDADGDGAGDACDGDDDGDGVPDFEDAFPLDPYEQVDTDSDGIGDNADPDDDDDGYSDEEELAEGTDPLNPFSFPLPEPPPEPEEPDSDGDGLVDSVDADDDDDCYSDSVETSLGSDPLNPLSRPADNDSDCSPDALDADDDDDGVPDSADAFPFDPAEWLDTDSDGTGNNADADDDGDGMPDAWETLYGLDPLYAGDADGDPDGDGHSNFSEFMGGTDPTSSCSPPSVNFCYDFIDEGGNGQCGGATGVHCAPLGEWTPQMLIDTDNRSGGCRQKFMLQSECEVDLEICVDFSVNTGGDGGQCKDQGVHCAGMNQWTTEIGLDMDGRSGWCNQQFFVVGEGEHFTLFMDFIGDDGLDSAGQCKVTGTSKAYSEYETGTAVIGLDTDNRPGGCFQRFMLNLGTWSITAF